MPTDLVAFKANSRNLAILLVVLPSCSPTTNRPTEAVAPVLPPVFDQQIVLGRRIGPVSLGMTSKDLFTALGSPSYTSGNTDIAASQYAWASLEIGVWVNKYDRVNMVYTSSPRYATPEGVRVGASVLELRAKQGSPAWYRSDNPYNDIYCYSPNTTFNVGGHASRTEGLVISIDVGACKS